MKFHTRGQEKGKGEEGVKEHWAEGRGRSEVRDQVRQAKLGRRGRDDIELL